MRAPSAPALAALTTKLRLSRTNVSTSPQVAACQTMDVRRLASRAHEHALGVIVLAIARQGEAICHGALSELPASRHSCRKHFYKSAGWPGARSSRRKKHDDPRNSQPKTATRTIDTLSGLFPKVGTGEFSDRDRDVGVRDIHLIAQQRPAGRRTVHPNPCTVLQHKWGRWRIRRQTYGRCCRVGFAR